MNIEIAPFPPMKPLPWYTGWIPKLFGPMCFKFELDITWCHCFFTLIIPWLIRLQIHRTSSPDFTWWWRVSLFGNPNWKFGNLA